MAAAAATAAGARHPPPQAPNLVEVMAHQTELLKRLAAAQINQGRQNRNNQQQEATFAEFLGTQPPLVSKTKDPLDADAWLHTMESKFTLLVNN